ncbi:MAG: hypothetical protein PHW95_00670 [Patescibacteria group bacterium]|nr:hypothetical protein [Patescibacteria group bacterium]
MISTVNNYIRNNWLALAMSVIVGALIAFPQILFIYQAGNNYQGINIFETDAEYYYISRINDVYNGSLTIANPYLEAGKNLPYVQPSFPEIIMGLTGRALHLSITQLLIFFRFVAPAFLFLIIYHLVVRLTSGQKLPALLGAAIAILAPNLLSYPQQFWHILTGTFQADTYLNYARPVNPQISSLFFFGFLYFFWRFIENRHKIWWFLSTLIFGVSFYVYPYTWTYLSVFVGLYFLFAAINRHWRPAAEYAALMICSYAVAITYFINTWYLIHHPLYEELMRLYGLRESHQFVFSGTVVAIVVLILAWYLLKHRQPKNELIFFIMLAAAGIIAINQHVITGQVLYYGHYHWYFIKPIFSIVLALILFAVVDYLKFNRLVSKVLFCFIVSLIFINAYNVQISAYSRDFSRYLGMQRYRLALDWLNAKTGTGETVYVPESFYFSLPDRKGVTNIPSVNLNRFISSYTNLNVYFSRYLNFYLIPYQDYRKYNLFFTLKLLGVTPDSTFQYLADHRDIFFDYYADYLKVRGLTFDDIPENELRSLAAEYASFYKNSWFDITKRYPLDYIVWDKQDLPSLPFDAINEGQNIYRKVFEGGGVVIYKLL